MSCDLISRYVATQFRARRFRAWGMMTHSMRRDGRFAWMLVSGGYLLHRKPFNLPWEQYVDEDYPVGVALKGATRITETFPNDPGGSGGMRYRLRAFGLLGVEDEADPGLTEQFVLIDGEVQLPVPPAPVSLLVEPIAAGKMRLNVQVNNIDATTQTAWLNVYTDGGTGGGVDYETRLGAQHPVSNPAFSTQIFIRDPGLASGTILEVGVRAESAAGGEEQNTVTRTVLLDADGPPQVSNFGVEVVCDDA